MVDLNEGSGDILPHKAKKRKEALKPRLTFPLNALSVTKSFNAVIDA